MQRKITSILCALLIASLSASTAQAGGNVKLQSAPTFNLGSLDVSGVLTGLGGYSTGVTVQLDAIGIPVVTCTTPGGNQAPGQNPPKVSASSQEYIDPQSISRKGKAPVAVSAEPASLILPGSQGGCPNDKWTAEIVFVYWTNATLTVTDNNSGAILLGPLNYTCTTTRTPDDDHGTPGDTMDDGTVSCVPS